MITAQRTSASTLVCSRRRGFGGGPSSTTPSRLKYPMRRVGEHIELANLAAFLVSDGAAYINGDAIVIDGGKMLQSGGGGANTSAMLDWTDEQWDAIRPKKK